MTSDLRAVLRMAGDREPEPSAVTLDSRTLRFPPESGARAGYDGVERKRGSKVHLAVDTPGHVVALHVTPADADDRGEVDSLTGAVQAETGGTVETGFVDQGYTGERAAEAARAHGIALEVVKAPEAKRGFVLLPRRWVVERSFARATRLRRLAKDYERYASTLAGLYSPRLRLPHAQTRRTTDDRFITHSMVDQRSQTGSGKKAERLGR